MGGLNIVKILLFLETDPYIVCSPIYLFVYLFILAALGLCCCVQAFSSCGRVGATLCCCAWASHCGGFSCCGVWAVGARASVVAARRLSSCGTWALGRAGFSSCGVPAQ